MRFAMFLSDDFSGSIRASSSGARTIRELGPEATWRKIILPVFLALCLIVARGPFALAQIIDVFPTLDAGYGQMYNLQFPDAHKTFHSWEELNPGDPLGPTSDAAAYLFSEFDRLGILQTELFVDDEKFNKGKKLVPDPASKQAFESALSKSELQADRVLMGSPQDKNALFAQVMNRGLRSDYLALIEAKGLAAL